MAEKTLKVLVYEPLEDAKVVEINNDLADFQNIVGGSIEIVKPFHSFVEDGLGNVLLICNEEGKLLGLPLNRALCSTNGEVRDVIAGTFLLCAKDVEEEGELASLTDHQIFLAKQRVGARSIR